MNLHQWLPVVLVAVALTACGSKKEDSSGAGPASAG